MQRQILISRQITKISDQYRFQMLVLILNVSIESKQTKKI